MELLERTESLQQLHEAWRDARSGTGRLVFVSGEAGIGKSSLVNQFVETETPRFRAAWGYCEPLGAAAPLAAMRDIARQIGGSLSGVMAATAPVQGLLPAILEALEQAGPMLLIFEDIHWADEATLEVLGYLGRRAAPGVAGNRHLSGR